MSVRAVPPVQSPVKSVASPHAPSPGAAGSISEEEDEERRRCEAGTLRWIGAMQNVEISYE